MKRKRRVFSEGVPQFLVSSPQTFWRFLAPTRSRMPRAGGWKFTNDTAQMESVFHGFFQSVLSKADEHCLLHFNEPSFWGSDISVFEEGDLFLLLALGVKKSAGPGYVPNGLWKRYAELAAQHLATVFLNSIEDGELPRDWLVAPVVPVFKSDEGGRIPNYRHISLTCISCKLLEHIVHRPAPHTVFKGKRQECLSGLSTVTQLVE